MTLCTFSSRRSAPWGAALLLAAGLAPAAASGGLNPTLADLSPQLNLRLRHESAAQDNVLRDAQANTLRHRLGLTTGSWRGLSLLLESEGVIALQEQRYNSGPGGNGHADRSVIADPTGNELNQAALRFAGNGLDLVLGRQRLIYDKARFIGNVGWRQNEQTFDALSARWSPLPALSLRYAHLRQVNRIFFSDADLRGNLLDVQASLPGGVSLGAYAYLLDFDTGTDSQTLGLRLSGQRPVGALSLRYRAEYATQQDYADAPTSVDADYRAAELGLAHGGWSLGLGQEVLGGDGVYGFATPLATLHAFNGWADMFLNTPAAGLRDSYLKAGYTRSGWRGQLIGHQFRADHGGADYGREFDLLLGYKLQPKTDLSLKFADYRADGFGVDTTRLTAQIDFSL